MRCGYILLLFTIEAYHDAQKNASLNQKVKQTWFLQLYLLTRRIVDWFRVKRLKSKNEVEATREHQSKEPQKSHRRSIPDMVKSVLKKARRKSLAQTIAARGSRKGGNITGVATTNEYDSGSMTFSQSGISISHNLDLSMQQSLTRHASHRSFATLESIIVKSYGINSRMRGEAGSQESEMGLKTSRPQLQGDQIPSPSFQFTVFMAILLSVMFLFTLTIMILCVFTSAFSVTTVMGKGAYGPERCTEGLSFMRGLGFTALAFSVIQMSIIVKVRKVKDAYYLLSEILVFSLSLWFLFIGHAVISTQLTEPILGPYFFPLLIALFTFTMTIIFPLCLEHYQARQPIHLKGDMESFAYVLETPKLYLEFKAEVSRQFCTEYIMFHEEYSKVLRELEALRPDLKKALANGHVFKEMVSAMTIPSELEKTIRGMFDTYVAVGAANELTLTASLRKAVEREIENKNLNPMVLFHVYEHVINVLFTNAYGPFFIDYEKRQKASQGRAP
jgi:hypothetical protein